MARIKLSPFISEIKGKLGNAVFQGGKSGIILRSKVVPRNKNTSSQIRIRSKLATAKTTWQNLTTVQRDSWISFTNFFQKKTKFDVTKLLTPYEMFIQYNVVRSQSFLGVLEETDFTTFTVDTFDVMFDISDPTKLIAEIEAIGLGFTSYLALYMSAPFKQSSSIAKSKVRFVLIGLNAFDNVDITGFYVKLFKRLPNVGDKVLVKMVAFSASSGWLTKPTFLEYVF